MSIEHTGEQLLAAEKTVTISRTAPLQLLLPEVDDFPTVDFRFFSLYSATLLSQGAEIFGPYEDECHLRVIYDGQALAIEKIPPLEYPAQPILRLMNDEEMPSLLHYLGRLVKLSQWPLSDQDRQVVDMLIGCLQGSAS